MGILNGEEICFNMVVPWDGEDTCTIDKKIGSFFLF
jgi:hypothetical protein